MQTPRAPTAAPPGVSVVICCYNSSSRIGRTLEHLARQKVEEELHWEVIVVDNGSADDTVKMATGYRSGESTLEDTRANFRVVSEPTPGLSNARRRGHREAVYDVLIYCDDDNWLSEEYVARAAGLMRRHPEIGAIGGRGIAEVEGEVPDWFEERAKSYAVGPQGQGGAGPIPQGSHAVYGAGMVVRRPALDRLFERGFRFLQSDRTGTGLASGGDAELCYAFRMMGYQIWYDSELTFRHFMPADRLRWSRHIQMLRGFGAAKPVAFLYRWYLDDRSKFESRFLWLRETGSAIRHYLHYRRRAARIRDGEPDEAEVQEMTALYRGMCGAFLRRPLHFREARQRIRALGRRLKDDTLAGPEVMR